MVKSNIPTIASVKPYSPLELEGRDLYIREGCVDVTQICSSFPVK
jgi:cytochrome c oxidase cbb3-type subunit I/II